MSSKNILTLLGGAHRRNTGRADQIARMVARNPRLSSNLMAGLWSDDPLLHMRAADAAEKVSHGTRKGDRMDRPKPL